MGFILAIGAALLVVVVSIPICKFLFKLIDCGSVEYIAMREEAELLGNLAQSSIVAIRERILADPDNEIYQAQLRKSVGKDLYKLALKGGAR